MAKPVTLREVAREGRECRQPRSHVTRMARSNSRNPRTRESILNFQTF
jgi:hypothetical protein